ncbi:hypothetical protein BDY19DRAFT_903178 [Irpex rosettiformis]|uniref:Uncharacterized protein n=1 Tax=Irpex rosettiformis TaxID=378272 RepID=A0ACB8UGI0_9APHY|nr:hypothetical protein BDY19DRAFT_903178 [Irpex rosettiformis]
MLLCWASVSPHLLAHTGSIAYQEPSDFQPACTSLDVVRISEAENPQSSSVILWIGAKSNFPDGECAGVAAYNSLDVLKKFYVNFDDDAEIRELSIFRSAGPSSRYPAATQPVRSTQLQIYSTTLLPHAVSEIITKPYHQSAEVSTSALSRQGCAFTRRAYCVRTEWNMTKGQGLRMSCHIHEPLVLSSYGPLFSYYERNSIGN